MTRRGHEQVAEVLREAAVRAVPDEALADRVRRVLRELERGSSEEELVLLLQSFAAPAAEPVALASVARALLKIGVRPRGVGWRRRTMGKEACTVCRAEVAFAWSCTCGFRICQSCVDANRWGMTCNNITWECPDCGSFRSF